MLNNGIRKTTLWLDNQSNSGETRKRHLSSRPCRILYSILSFSSRPLPFPSFRWLVLWCLFPSPNYWSKSLYDFISIATERSNNKSNCSTVVNIIHCPWWCAKTGWPACAFTYCVVIYMASGRSTSMSSWLSSVPSSWCRPPTDNAIQFTTLWKWPHTI